MPRLDRIVAALALAASSSFVWAQEAGGFSIRGHVVNELLADGTRVVTLSPPLAQGPCGFALPATFSGDGCREVATRYTVRGAPSGAIPALFEYTPAFGMGAATNAGNVFFEALDSAGHRLAALQFQFFKDEGILDQISCGPLPGACVTSLRLDFGGPGLPLLAPLVYPPSGEGPGAIPFYLPAGVNLELRARLGIFALGSETGIVCDERFGRCLGELDVTFSLVPLLPPGATFLEPVPEPTTVLLFSTSLAGLAAAAWRRCRRRGVPLSHLRAFRP